MFYLRSTVANPNIHYMFGTTEKGSVPPSSDPIIFTHTSTPRLMFLQYRIKSVLSNTLNISPSISCIGDDYNNKTGVMLKIFFLLHGEEQLGIHRLMYETQVYKFITNELGPVAALFVPWHKTYMFSGWDLDIGKWDTQDLNNYRQELLKSGHYEGYRDLYKHFTSQVNVNMAFAQITKRDEKDVTLLSFLRADNGTLEMLKQIIFQVVFALACLVELRAQHNDAHINNVLISFDLPKRKKGYFFKGRMFSVEQFLQIKLFDWDLAYVESLGPNQGLSEETYRKNGVGNYFNPRFDLYTFLSSLEQFYRINNLGLPGPILEFIASTRPLLYQLEQNRLCNVDPVTKTCIPFPENEPRQILTPEQALMLPLFDTYRVRDPVLEQVVSPGVYKFQLPPKDGWFTRVFKSS